MSDADRVRLSYAEETTFADEAFAPSALIDLRFTAESLKQATDVARSAEIRDDRQTSDVVRVGVRAEGDINFEFSDSTFDDLIVAVLQASDTWGSAPSDITGTTFSLTAATDTLSDSGSGMGALAVGDLVMFNGFTGAMGTRWNKKLGILTSAAAGAVVILGHDYSADKSAGDTVTLRRAVLIENGTNQRTFAFEKKFTDLTNVFHRFWGCGIEKMVLNFDASQITTGAFTILGKKQTIGSATIGSSYTTAPTGRVSAAVDGFHGFILAKNKAGETALAIPIMSGQLTVMNNLRARLICGELGAESLGSGKCQVSGNANLYFKDSALLASFLAFDDFQMAFAISAPGGDYYCFHCPAVKITDLPTNATGENTDIMAQITFEAKRDATTGKTLRIGKIAGF